MHGDSGTQISSSPSTNNIPNVRKIHVTSIRNESARNGLGILLRLLRGDQDTIAQVSETWQEYIASMAFFSKPFAYNTHKDVLQLYEEAMDLGFSIDTTLPSEVASSALFTSDLPRVWTSSRPAADSRPSSTFSKRILR